MRVQNASAILLLLLLPTYIANRYDVVHARSRSRNVISFRPFQTLAALFLCSAL